MEAEQVDYQQLTFKHAGPPEEFPPGRHQVVVVGAGPVGLATAIDLAQRGTKVLLLDDDDRR